MDTVAVGGRTTGSGLVLNRRGIILTNFHVISPASPAGRIVVKFSNSLTGRRWGQVRSRPPVNLSLRVNLSLLSICS